MDIDTSDAEVCMNRKKGKPPRKRKISSDTDVDHPPKRNEEDSPIALEPSTGDSAKGTSDQEEDSPKNSARSGQIFDIKARAESAQQKILNHLSNPANEISKFSGKYILSKVSKLQGLLQEALLLNSNLEGQLQAMKASNTRQATAASTLDNSTGRLAQPQKLTYAERLGIRSRTAEISNLKQDPPNVVLIRPTDTSRYTNSDETKQALISIVSPKKNNLQVKNVRKIQGNGIVVETAKSDNVQSLLRNEKLKTAGLVVNVPQKKSPRIIVYGAPRREDDTEVLNAILEQNLTTEEIQKYKTQVKIAFKTGSKDNKDTCNLVLEVSKEAREVIIKRERLYIMWQCCHVQDFVAATRCYKCQAFGHTTKHCRAEKEVCGHCANAGHGFRNCPNKAKEATCVNCKKAGKQHNHSVTHKDCPAHIAAVNQVLARTDYGF